MIIMLRHAERGDNETPTKLSQIPYDPPIIDQSTQTIQNTCSEIVDIFKKNGIKKFQILTSKFLRCLMTATKIQTILEREGFVIDGDGSYMVDNRIGEYLRQDWYEHYPMDQLIYHSDHLNKYLGRDIKFRQVFKSSKYKQFPQNYVKFHFRVANFKKQLKFPQPGTCLLIITHGFVVRELCFTMNQLPRYQNQIKYCGYVAYRKENDGEVIIRAKL